MKRVLVAVFIILLTIFPLYSDEYKEGVTLRTEINGVGNFSGFGFGLFPVSTSFQFYKTDLNVFSGSTFKSKIYYYMSYGFSNVSESGRQWNTGRPTWDMTIFEKNQIDATNPEYDDFSVGSAFRQYGTLELWFGQPFIENPVREPEYDQLFEFRLGINTRYTATTESLNLGAGGNPTFVDINGDPTGIFAISDPSNPIVAWPWLNGNRQSLSNYLFARLYFYPYRDIRESVQDGVYGYVNLEYGPKWLLNDLLPSGYTSSDFFRAEAYLEEKLLLFDDRQENGWNWFAIYLGHSNTYNYTAGDVVPYYKIPTDGLEHSLTDRFWFHFMLPNFITPDCYAYFEASMTNSLYWGNVVNATGKYSGLSYTGRFDFKFHLRLFGFIRIEYNCYYDFARGINSNNPAWSQNASLNFYVSV